MLVRRFNLESARYPAMLEAVKDFAKKGRYVLVEASEENGFTISIYDRRRESSLASVGFFFGSLLANPGRIRVVIRGVRHGPEIENVVTGDVLFAAWDIVDDRPKRTDVLRCQRMSEWLLEVLESF